MNLFDRYGIKEVADVTFYELNGTRPGKPVLYLDTLKVSTIEQTAENTEARGGKGNTALMAWDYGKEITINLEDALFSQRSLEIMYGGKQASYTRKITKTKNYTIKKGNTYPFFVYKTEDDGVDEEGWYFNSENAKNFGLPWVTIYADGENAKTSSGTGKATATCEPPISDGATTVSCYGDIDSGILVDSVLEGELPSFELNLATGDETEIVEILPKNGTYHFEVFWTEQIVPDQKTYSKIIPYSYSYRTAINYEGFQFIENGKDLRGEGSLILNEEAFPLQKVIDPDLLFFAGLDPKGKSEINLTGTHLFQFELLIEGDRLARNNEIEISANTFPGTYYVIGDTYARNEKTGKDEFFQIHFPKVKVLSESNTIALEADGDPTVFNMSLKALKNKSAPLMKLVKYTPGKLIPVMMSSAKFEVGTGGGGTLIKKCGKLGIPLAMSAGDYTAPAKNAPQNSFTVGGVAVQEGVYSTALETYVNPNVIYFYGGSTTSEPSSSEGQPQALFVRLLEGYVLALIGLEGLVIDSGEKSVTAYIGGTDGNLWLRLYLVEDQLMVELGVEEAWLRSPEFFKWLALTTAGVLGDIFGGKIISEVLDANQLESFLVYIFLKTSIKTFANAEETYDTWQSYITNLELEYSRDPIIIN